MTPQFIEINATGGTNGQVERRFLSVNCIAMVKARIESNAEPRALVTLTNGHEVSVTDPSVGALLAALGCGNSSIEKS